MIPREGTPERITIQRDNQIKCMWQRYEANLDRRMGPDVANLLQSVANARSKRWSLSGTNKVQDAFAWRGRVRCGLHGTVRCATRCATGSWLLATTKKGASKVGRRKRMGLKSIKDAGKNV